MSPELDTKLCERHPRLFKSASLDKGWGFECLDGWFGIIDTLCSLIENHQSRGSASRFRIYRIREKFGLLEVNYAHPDRYIQGLVDMASAMSGQICEVCSQNARINESGDWLSTRCPEHEHADD